MNRYLFSHISILGKNNLYFPLLPNILYMIFLWISDLLFIVIDVENCFDISILWFDGLWPIRIFIISFCLYLNKIKSINWKALQAVLKFEIYLNKVKYQNEICSNSDTFDRIVKLLNKITKLNNDWFSWLILLISKLIYKNFKIAFLFINWNCSH